MFRALMAILSPHKNRTFTLTEKSATPDSPRMQNIKLAGYHLKLPAFLFSPAFALLVLYLCWLAVSCPSLLTYPVPHSDEAWFGSTGVSMLQSGQNEVLIFGDTSGLYRSQTVWHLFAVLMGGWFRLWGVGFLQARLLSLTGAALCGLLVYWFASLHFSRIGAWLATALYLFSLRILYTSHMLRPDAWVQMLGFSTWLGYFLWHKHPRIWKAILLGFLCTAIIDLSPIVVYFSATAGLWAFGESCWRKKWGQAVALVGGAMLGLGYYYIAQILPNANASSEIGSVFSAFSDANAFSFLTKGFWRYLKEDLFGIVFLTGLWKHSRVAPIETLFWLAGLCTAIFRRKHLDWFLLSAGGILWLGFLLPYKGLHHLTEFVPWFSLLSVGFATCLADTLAQHWKKPQWRNILPIGLLSPLLFASIVGMALLGQRSAPIRYERAAAEIRALLPDHPTILAEGSWYWWFHETPFTTDEYIRLVQDGFPELSARQALERVLRDRQINTLLVDEHFSFHLIPANQNLQDEIETYVANHCTLAGQVTFPGYGVEHGGPFDKTTRVYHCSPLPQTP